MKNRNRDFQYERNRYTDNDRYRRNYNDYGNNDNNYYSNRYDRNDYQLDYSSYDDDYIGSSRNYNDYNDRQSYRNNDYQSNTYGNNDWRDNNWNSRNSDYSRYSSGSNRGNNRNESYNNQDRGWWDRTRDEVSSWFGDEDAERRRRMDELRDDNHRGKGPKNYTRSQERIKEDVNDKLSDHWMLDASNIEVEVKGSEVILNGTVSDKKDKRRAEDIVDSVSGVTHVQNNLRVSKSEEQDTNSSSRPYTVRSKKNEVQHN